MKLRKTAEREIQRGTRPAARALRLLALGASLLAAGSVWASPSVTYTAVNLSGSSWEYDYTVTGPIDYFGGVDIVFDYLNYTNLASGSVDPSTLINQPDPITPLDGDVFALFDTAALASGASALFSVTFDWLGTGAPGAQDFNIFDANGGSAGSGRTRLTETNTAVPEPSPAALVAVALLALGLSRRRAA